jgi:signal transduction histidine kinase/DNA-binding response OmpR family regulator
MLFPKRNPLLIFTLLTGLGLVGNYFSFPVFYSIDFLFGSIFSMLALQLLGPRLGVASALVVGSVTLMLWNHPYAIVIFTAEAVVVALLTRRRVSFVKADAIYWCAIGIPLVFLFYYYVMQLPLSNVTVTLLKQALNGIWNALVARVIFTGLNQRLRQASFSLREITFNFMLLLVLLVMLVAIGINSRRERSELDGRIRESLLASERRTAANLHDWLRGSVRQIDHLAKSAASQSVSDMQRHIDHLQLEESDFLRVGLVDTNAIIVAHSQRRDLLGQSNIGRKISEPPELARLKQNLAPMLGEIVMSRTGKPEPIATVLAPVVSTGGAYGGYAIGILNPLAIEKLLALNSRTDLAAGETYTLLDQTGKVIVSNNAKQTIMQPFARQRGELIQLGEGLMQWLPDAARGISVSGRWSEAVYIHESGIGGISGWKLVLEIPVNPFAQKLCEDYTRKLSYLAIIMLLVFLLAEFLSRKIAGSLEELENLSEDLPRRVSANEDIDWGHSSIAEVQALKDKFSGMAKVLEQQFEEIRAFNASLESKVALRTEELTVANTELAFQNEEKGKRADELTVAKEAAEAANIAKSRFLAAMSHEIRTPMNGILGMAQVLQMPDISEAERLDSARTILGSGQTLLTLLNDILDLSKIEAGKVELEAIAFDPAQVFGEAQALFAEIARGKGLRIETDWSGAPRQYLGDPHRLRQMLSNLVGNAVKFTDQGLIRIEAHEVGGDGQAALLEFSVSDSGIGIAEDDQAQLFRPFSQADNSITRRYGGSGLGLSLVATLARLMGGEVGVDSEVGRGSRFWFRIRAGLLAADRPATPAADAGAGSGRPAQFAGRVLVVEDDPGNQKVIEIMLRKLGLDTVVAADGQHALDALAGGEAADLILMDVQMPRLDGYRATEVIRRREKEAGEPRRPIIALTAEAFAEDRQRCLGVGMDDVLTKPIFLADLQIALRRWLPDTARARVTPPAAMAVATTPDVPRITQTLRELLPLLQQNKFNALAKLRELEELTAGSDVSAEIADAGRQLRLMRFDLALDQLTVMANNHDWTI